MCSTAPIPAASERRREGDDATRATEPVKPDRFRLVANFIQFVAAIVGIVICARACLEHNRMMAETRITLEEAAR